MQLDMDNNLSYIPCGHDFRKAEEVTSDSR